jgi:hypothetical protein
MPMTTAEVIQCLENKIKYQEDEQERAAKVIDRATVIVLRSRATVAALKLDIARLKASLSESGK